MTTLIDPHRRALRAAHEQMRVTPLSVLARAPGAGDLYRLTILYFDRRARASCATAWTTHSGARLALTFEGMVSGGAIDRTIDRVALRDLAGGLRTVGFDALPDHPALPTYFSADIWLVERAAGAFSHGVVVAPVLAQVGDPYYALSATLRRCLPDALRTFGP